MATHCPRRAWLAFFALATALPAQMLWQPIGPAQPPPRAQPAAAWDSQRQVAVTFAAAQATWEWNGASWSSAPSPTAPAQAIEPAMAFDPVRNQTVLVGAQMAPSSETWLWNGTAWSLAQPTSGLPPRLGAAMCWDPVRQVVLLFGGLGTSGALGDTWQWDGTSWTQRFHATNPPPRFQAALAWDPVRQRAVMFGGTDGGPSRGDTWTWDGSNWQARPVPGPSNRSHSRLAWDSGSQRLILFGGRTYTNPRFFDDTWAWNGSGWSRLAPATVPPARASHLLVQHPPTQSVLLASGTAPDWSGRGDAWLWSGSDWVAAHGAGAPNSSAHGACWDPVRQQLLVVTKGVVNEAWVWQQGAWNSLGPVTPAGFLPIQPRMVFDSTRQQAVLVGSAPASNAPSWTWDGTAWTRRADLALPREDFGLAFDSARGRTVLFGGRYLTFALQWIHYGDTWEFDGATWQQRTPTQSPPLLSAVAMGYDRLRQNTVLFGGEDPLGTASSATWTYDGQTWRRATPTRAPSPTVGAALAWDEDRGRLVLSRAGTGAATWEWDGFDWTPIPTAASPPLATGPTTDESLVWDGSARQLLLLRGSAPATAATAWGYAPTVATATLLAGAPCGGGGFAPAIDANSPAILGNSQFGYQLTNLPAQSLSLLKVSLVGGAPTPLPGGCLLHALDPAWDLLQFSSASGTAFFAVPIPPLTALRGAIVTAQGFSLLAGGPVAGLAVATPGLLVRIGD